MISYRLIENPKALLNMTLAVEQDIQTGYKPLTLTLTKATEQVISKF